MVLFFIFEIMATISLIQHKGGSSKTTTVLSLYFSFIESDTKTLVIDIDPQKSLTNLNGQLNCGINVISKLDTKKIGDHQLTLIDTPPTWSKQIEKAVQLSDLIIVPLKSSTLDAMATISTVRDIRAITPKKSVFALLTMCVPGTTFDQDVIELLKSQDIQVLKTKIGNRIAYAKLAFTAGNIYNSKNPKAKEECKNLALEIYSKLVK